MCVCVCVCVCVRWVSCEKGRYEKERIDLGRLLSALLYGEGELDVNVNGLRFDRQHAQRPGLFYLISPTEPVCDPSLHECIWVCIPVLLLV